MTLIAKITVGVLIILQTIKAASRTVALMQVLVETISIGTSSNAQVLEIIGVHHLLRHVWKWGPFRAKGA